MTQTAPGTEGSGPPADVLLNVTGLEVWYGPERAGGVRAVHDATFVVHKGEVVGIAGESGSGKSTLAFAVARLLKGSGHITGGSVRWYGPTRGAPADGLDLATASDETLRQIRWKGVSIVLQSAMSAMNPVLSVRSQIDDVLRAHEPGMSRRQRTSRVAALLEMVGIPARRAAAYPHELSGGMRQRAMIAMALALSPQLVILDEPTTALDVVMQRQILERLTALQDDLGFAVLFITHDLSLLLEVSDETLVMYAGAVVEKATAHDLYDSPRHPYSTGLLRSFPKVAGERQELLGIPGSPPNLRELPPGCAFHPRCPHAMPRCEQEVPQLTWRTAAGEGAARQVACFLYGDADGAQAGQRSPAGQEDAAGRVSGQEDSVRS